MKKILTIFLAILLFSAVLIPVSAFAAEEEGPLQFTLIILGTRHYSDVEVMSKNVARIPSMARFNQTISSQNHLEFAGTFGGQKDQLVADIEGLAADRYSVQTKNDKERGLVITVRKLSEEQK